MKNFIKYILIFIAGIVIASIILYNAFINAEVDLMDNVENGNKIVLIKLLDNFYTFEVQEN